MINGSTTHKHRLMIAFIVFLAVFISYFACPIVTSLDSKWTVHVAMSILREGNIDLDEYGELLDQDRYYAIEEINGHKYCVFPAAVSLLAAPFVYVIDRGMDILFESVPGMSDSAAARRKRSLGHLYVVLGHKTVELVIASFMTAAAAALMYLVASLHVSRKYALVMVFVFAFCTSTWSVASRALWQHGPSILMLCLALYLIHLAEKKPFLVQFASLPLAYAFLVRPLNSISFAVLSVYVLWQHRRFFLAYIFWAFPVFVPFVLYSLSVYQSTLPPYFMPGRLGFHPHLIEALAGNLISPARGLFVFTPVLLFSIFGAVRLLSSGRAKGLGIAVMVVVFLHWITISAFPHWWAGHSYGPRYFSDMAPFFIYLMIPAVSAVSGSSGPWRKALLCAAFVVLAGVSFFIHFRGAVSVDVHRWNHRPVDVNRDRIWDWSDPPFMRGIIKQLER